LLMLSLKRTTAVNQWLGLITCKRTAYDCGAACPNPEGMGVEELARQLAGADRTADLG